MDIFSKKVGWVYGNYILMNVYLSTLSESTARGDPDYHKKSRVSATAKHSIKWHVRPF